MSIVEKVKTFFNKVLNRDSRVNDDQQVNDDEQPTTSHKPLERAKTRIKNMTKRFKSKRSRENKPGDAPEAVVIVAREEVQVITSADGGGTTSALQCTETRKPQAEVEQVAVAQPEAVAKTTPQEAAQPEAVAKTTPQEAAQPEAVAKTTPQEAARTEVAAKIAPQAAQEGSTSSFSKPKDVKNNGREQQRVMTPIPEEKTAAEHPLPHTPGSSSAPYAIDGNMSEEDQEETSGKKDTAQ